MLFRKHCLEPYLSYLLEGKKTVEGRVWQKDWQKMCVGDILELYHGSKQGRFQIRELTYACDFGVLFELFGEKLLPGVHNCSEAVGIYQSWFSLEKVKECGVVGVHLERI